MDMLDLSSGKALIANGKIASNVAHMVTFFCKIIYCSVNSYSKELRYDQISTIPPRSQI